MSEQRPPKSVNRRNFLKGIGIATGIAALSPFPFVSPVAARFDPFRESQPVKVGLMIPKSNLYPSLGTNLTNGMKLGFDQYKQHDKRFDFEIVSEDIGFGSKDLVNKSLKLTQENKADVVVAYLNPDVVPQIQDVFEKNKTALIAVGAGENIVRSSDKSPYVFYNTFGMWQSNWTAGEWAARNVGNTAFIATSFYEGGYDSSYAFAKGFESAGGSIVGSKTTGGPSDEATAYDAIQEIESLNPDLVYALYSGTEAVDFVRTYSSSNLGGQVPLMASGFTINDEMLPHMGSTSDGIRSVMPWANTLGTSVNKDFSSTYTSKTGRSADMFSVLGFETAQLISQAVRSAGGTQRTRNLIDAISYAEFDSPRGRLRMNPQTHSSTTPLYLREVQQKGFGTANVVLNELRQHSAIEDTILADLEGPKTGWINAYLAV